jgi:hypothetical protein
VSAIAGFGEPPWPPQAVEAVPYGGEDPQNQRGIMVFNTFEIPHDMLIVGRVDGLTFYYRSLRVEVDDG